VIIHLIMYLTKYLINIYAFVLIFLIGGNLNEIFW